MSTGTITFTTVIALFSVANSRTPYQFSAESTTARPMATATPPPVRCSPDISHGRKWSA